MNLFEGTLVRLTAAHSEADAKLFASWWHDTEFARLLDESPAWPVLAKQVQEDLEAEPKPNSFPFLVRTLAEDRLIGFVGLWTGTWAHGDAWVGIGIGERADWGKGYGTDAMRAMLRYGFTELNLHRVSLIAFSYNARAIRSYEKAGFVVEGRFRQSVCREGKRWDDVYMGILREDWEKAEER